jgi:hypothetical protein
MSNEPSSANDIPSMRITCGCPICASNASTLGRDVLAAKITTAGIAKLSKTGKLSKAATHSVVYTANHPQIGKSFAEGRTAYWSVP